MDKDYSPLFKTQVERDYGAEYNRALRESYLATTENQELRRELSQLRTEMQNRATPTESPSSAPRSQDLNQVLASCLSLIGMLLSALYLGARTAEPNATSGQWATLDTLLQKQIEKLIKLLS